MSIKYPFIAYTWTILSEQVAVKQIDKSVFVSRETGIPREVAFFFELEDMQAAEKRNVQIIFNNTAYEAYFYQDPSKSRRLKLRWKRNFDEKLSLYFTKVMNEVIQGNDLLEYNEPLMELIKQDSTKYEVILRYRGHQVSRCLN